MAFLRPTLFALLLLGCLPDTDFRVADDPTGADLGGLDGGDPPDGGGTDLGSGDLGPPRDLGGADLGPEEDECLPAPTCTDGCPMPWLLASVEDLPGGRDCGGGRVLRVALTGPRESCICTGYDGAGAMPALPRAVGFSPPGTVVVAAEDASTVAIDAATDRVIWDLPIGNQPVDIFAIENPVTGPAVGVATRMRGGQVRAITFYDAATGGTPVTRTVNGDLPLGLGIESVTQATFDDEWFRVLDVDSYAAADVNPWTDDRIDPPYVASRDGRFPNSIYAAYVDGRHRTLWTGTRTDLPDDPSRVWDLGVAAAGGDHAFPLPHYCSKYEDGLDYDVECDFVHAVPNPDVFNGMLALCEYTGGGRIVWMTEFDRCETLIEQNELFSSARITRLALGLPTYWGP